MEKKAIHSPLVPETSAPFNPAVSFGPFIFISGMPPFEEEYCQQIREARAKQLPPTPMPDTPFEKQAHISLNHVKALLEEAGSNMDCLLKVTVFLKDQTKMEEFDRIYKTYFSSPEVYPARTRIQAGRTPLDCGLEIEAIGFIPGMQM